MNIVVPIKLVPDLVEELVIDESGLALDASFVRLILNEFDDHAVEQAILLKEKDGSHVTIVAMDGEGVDDALYAGAAKGADRLMKLTTHHEGAMNSHALARIFANAVKTLRPELILCGVQAHDDLDGAVGPQLAEHLGMPYVGYVAGVATSGDKTTVRKEYPGGLIAEMEVTLPAVLGIQAAEKPPRYIPISKIRQTMKSATVEEQPAAEPEFIGGPTVTRVSKPQVTARAEMIEGDIEEIASELSRVMKQLGAL